MKVNEFDQFYTNPLISDKLVKKTFELLPSLKTGYFLEPSAGTGNFIVSLIAEGISDKKIRAIDIDPKNNQINKIQIETKDYLNLKIKYDSKLTIIGNPPFGNRGKLALQFLNKALNEANVVALVLPNIFNRYSIQSKVDPAAQLIYSNELEEKSFIVNDSGYGVKCTFQIWIKNFKTYQKDLRIKEKPAIKHPDFETWIHNNTQETLKYFDKKKYRWDFAVIRQGYYDYKEKIVNPKKLVSNRQYFFVKYNNQEAKEIIEQIDFEKLSKSNTQILGFSTTDFVKEYMELKGEKNELC